jgi:hypothetical protein
MLTIGGRRSTMKKALILVGNFIRRREDAATYGLATCVLAFCFVSAAMAQIQPSPILTNQLLAKALPDECFAGIGQPYPAMLSPGVCPSGSIPKINQAYVWGLAQSGTKLWFGTAPNVFCLAKGQRGDTAPAQTANWVCEFGAGQYAKDHNLPAASGDWRPPKAFVYDLGTGSLTDITPADRKFTRLLGVRSAGALGDIVFLAGPALSAQGVNFFAFSSSAQQYLGACQVSSFSNIRQWKVINNVLYAGVGNVAGGGQVIRWNGTADQPFDNTSATCGFEAVGNLPGEPAYLTAYGPNTDRIAVSAWPNHGGAGIYLSPAMDVSTGLTSSDAANWTHIWRPSMYEPDPLTSSTYAGGAIAYWNGALYFGTMHQVSQATALHNQTYGPPTTNQESVEVFQNTYRAASIWEIQNAETKTPIVQLLYGESALPKFDPATNTFQSTPTGFTPLYGSSGFGNIYNNYTWTGTIFQNRLFFGTMDWSYLQAAGGLPLPAPGAVQPRSAFGADLWRFDSPAPAVAENLNGLGNFLNYGLRSMISSPDGQDLFLGTANPMNLAPMGGWELRLLQLKP